MATDAPKKPLCAGTYWVIVNEFGRKAIPILPTVSMSRAAAWAKFDEPRRGGRRTGYRAVRFQMEDV